MRTLITTGFVAFMLVAWTQSSSTATTDFTELPTIRWAFRIDTSFFSSPMVDDGVVYIGGMDSSLHVLNLSDGKELWTFQTKGPIRSNVCIAGEKLFLNGGDGSVYALNKHTGKLIWRFETKGERKYDFADYFHSSPVLYNDLVLVGSGDGNLYALEASAGKEKWHFCTGNVIHSTPVLANDKVFFGSFDGYFYAVNALTGDFVWTFKTVGHRYFPIGEVQGSPAVYENLVFVGARDYNVYALDQEKGFCHWNKAFTNGWGLCTTINDSVLYIGSADERVLIAADPLTGDQLWQRKMEFLVFGNNAFTDGLLYVVTTIGKLHAISKESGSTKWSFETDSYKKHRDSYFKPDDSYRDDIYSIIRSNEEFLDVECKLGGVFSTPVITGDYLLFSTADGVLYCLSR